MATGWFFTAAEMTGVVRTPAYLPEVVPEMVAVPSWLSVRTIPPGNPEALITGTTALQVCTVKLKGTPAVAVAEAALVMAGATQFPALTVTDDGAEVTTVLWGSVPLAVAVLVTEPFVRSAAVVVCVPVQVSLGSGGQGAQGAG